MTLSESIKLKACFSVRFFICDISILKSSRKIYVVGIKVQKTAALRLFKALKLYLDCVYVSSASEKECYEIVTIFYNINTCNYPIL